MNEEYYQIYLQDLKKIPPCTDQERLDLLPRAASGDEAARVRLIEGHLIFALAAAKDYQGKGLPMSDLIQEANLALTMVVSSYREGDFLKMAGERMTAFLQAAIKEHQAEKELGDRMVSRVNVLQEVSRVMAEELGREATLEELAQRMGMSSEEVKGIMKLAVDALSVTKGGN